MREKETQDLGTGLYKRFDLTNPFSLLMLSQESCLLKENLVPQKA